MDRLAEYKRTELLKLVERDAPKPPDRVSGIDTTGYRFKCPICRHPLGNRGRGHGGYMDYEKFCPRCAQRLDWNARGVHPGWGEYTEMKMAGSVGYREEDDE